jgi:hypothetical protein
MAPVVIATDPTPDRTAGALKTFDSMAVNALVLEGFDDPLDHAVLSRDTEPTLPSSGYPPAVSVGDGFVSLAKVHGPLMREVRARPYDGGAAA